MSGLFDVISGFLKGIIDFIPRFLLVEKTHKAIGFIRGNKVRIYEPGFFKNWYWPIWTSITEYPVVRQTVPLPQQVLTTRDDVTIVVDSMMVHSIANMENAFTRQEDLNDTIRDLTLASNKTIIMGYTYEEMKNSELIDKKLTSGVSKKLLYYGVKVHDVKLTSFAKTFVVTLSNMGSSSTMFNTFGGE